MCNCVLPGFAVQPTRVPELLFEGLLLEYRGIACNKVLLNP
jgi:hypothetical protein